MRSYLETLVSALTRGDILAGVGHSDYRDVVVVTSEELLSARNNVSNNNGGAQREDHVFVIGVKNKAFSNLACRKESMNVLRTSKRLEKHIP
jgi:hypothetical protein